MSAAARQRLGEWKKVSAAKAKQAIGAVEEAKKIVLKTCKLADDVFKGIARDGEKAAKDIEAQAEARLSNDEEDEHYDRDIEMVSNLEGAASEGLDVSSSIDDAKSQIESALDELIGSLEEAAEQIRQVVAIG